MTATQSKPALVKRVGPNTAGRDFVVGDIHGMFALLRSALEAVEFDAGHDRLFCVGDLVDRGPASEEARHWCDYPWFHCVRGNHEQMCIERSDMHAINGGAWFMKLDATTQDEYIACFNALPIAIEIDSRVGLVHADPVFPTWQLLTGALEAGNEQAMIAALWSRRKIEYEDPDVIHGINEIICGHTVIETPLRLGNVLYIDTGACFGMSLTLYELGTKQLHSFKTELP